MQTISDKEKDAEVATKAQDNTEKRCTFMELALCLTPGLPTPAIQVLYKIAGPASQVFPSPWLFLWNMKYGTKLPHSSNYLIVRAQYAIKHLPQSYSTWILPPGVVI